MEELNIEKIEDIILNLKLISKIKQNDKMVVINKVIQVDNRFLQPLWRWYTSDNRTETFIFITLIVNKAIEYTISKDKRTEDTIYSRDGVQKDLKNSLLGLENLGATYKNDMLISSKLDLLKEKISKVCNVTNKTSGKE